MDGRLASSRTVSFQSIDGEENFRWTQEYPGYERLECGCWYDADSGSLRAATTCAGHKRDVERYTALGMGWGELIPESFEDLVYWYQHKYTKQLVNNNTSPERMVQNLAIIRDAIYSYRSAIKYEGWKPAKRDAL